MALFENFPYTNLHDLNLDWVLSTIRKLIAEWAAYQEAMNKAFGDLQEAFNDLRQYVMDYFDNLDLTEAVTEAVEATLQEMMEDGSLDRIIGEYIKNIGGSGKISVNLLAEYLTDTKQTNGWLSSSEHFEHAPQGLCYIGNNRVVLYVLTKPGPDNMGVFICIDMSTGTILWKSDRIKCYHGNSLAYKDGYIYAAGAVDVTKVGDNEVQSANHSIFKVNINTPSLIDTTYTVLGQNIAIDDVTGAFYVGGGQLGSNANKVWKYADEAALAAGEYEEITLEATPLTQYLFTKAETQGICVHNGTLLQLFSRELSACCAFDMTDGHYVRGWNIPYIWNGCKYSQELEDIAYDPDSDRYLIMSSTATQRTHNCQVANIGEAGLYKNVVERLPRYAVYEGANGANDVVDVQVENDSATVGETGACLPFFDRHPLNAQSQVIANTCIFYNAYDAELFASMRGNIGYVHYVAKARHTGHPVFSSFRAHTNFKLSAASGSQLRITTPDLRRVDSAYITGSGSAGLVNFYGSTSDHAVFEVRDNTKLILENVEFEPSLDSVVRGIDVYRCGTVRFSQTVQMASGYEALDLYRVRTQGVIDNCVKVYDGPASRGVTYNFELPAWSTGLLVFETFINGQSNHAMFVVDREGGKAATNLDGSAALKMMIPVDGDYYIANLNISQTAFRFYALKKASDGTNVDGFDRVIVRQYPNVTYFSKHYYT